MLLEAATDYNQLFVNINQLWHKEVTLLTHRILNDYIHKTAIITYRRNARLDSVNLKTFTSQTITTRVFFRSERNWSSDGGKLVPSIATGIASGRSSRFLPRGEEVCHRTACFKTFVSQRKALKLVYVTELCCWQLVAISLSFPLCYLCPNNLACFPWETVPCSTRKGIPG
jgi:hypothetical protein